MKINKRFKVFFFTLILVIVAASVTALSMNQSTGTAEKESGAIAEEQHQGFVDAEIWTAERLYKEDVIEYVLVDNGILKVNDSISKWVNEHVETKGVYATEEEDFTYVMISTGEDRENKAIQLYDVREGKSEVYVGFDVLTVDEEQTVSFDKSNEEHPIAFMLIRFDAVNKPITDVIVTP